MKLQPRSHMQTTMDGLPTPQRYWAILTLAMAIALAVLDSFIANVALPTIARDLDVSPATSIWAVNAYQIAVIVSLLPLSSLGDIYGYRRIYRVGLAIFTLASLACVLAPSFWALAAARAMQSIGAAGILSVNVALIRFIYPRASLGRGIGMNALVVATGSVAGPTVAAGILSVATWPWLFAVNLPIGFVAFWIARTLPPNQGSGDRFDLSSALLSAGTFALLIVGMGGIGTSDHETWIWIELAAALCLGVALIRRQAGEARPMLAIDLFRRLPFTLAIATSFCFFIAAYLAYVSLPFFFQEVLGRSQAETGLLMTPWPAATAMAAPLAGRLSDRWPRAPLAVAGMAIMALGLVLLTALPPNPSNSDIVWRMIVCGLGFGLFQTPNNKAIVVSAPLDRSGGANGVAATTRQLGMATGAALVAIIFRLGEGQDLLREVTIALLLAAGFATASALGSSLRMIGFTRSAETRS